MKQRDIFLIVIPSFILVALWVVFSIYHNFVSSTISNPLSVQIQPIEPSFNSKSIKDIKERQQIEPIYESSVQSESQSSGSAQPTPIASSGGSLGQ